MSLTGKIALVTGSTRGIGKAIAEALSAEGAKVIISGRSGGIRCDVRDLGQVQSLMGEIDREYHGLDILVNNAGIGIFGKLGELSPEHWRAVIDTNLTGVFYCCHAALPLLKQRGGGWIVNIASLACRNAFPGGIAYNASKFGLRGYSEALMQDLLYDNIRVTTIAPGSVETEFGAPSHQSGDWKLLGEDVARVVVDTLYHDPRSLPSYIEIRPSKPPRKK